MSTASSTPRLSREVRATGLLALPLVLGHVSTGLISFVDNVIAGHHGTHTLAAVTIGTALLWLPMLIPIGTLISLTASVSQLHGAGREREIGPLFRQALWLALGLGLIMFTFLTVVPPLLPAFGIAPDIVPGATAFLHAVRWGGPALTLYFCMRYLSEGMHWTLPTMLLGFGGLLVLAPLGYVLCYGKLGFPELGAEGLGMASAIMMWLQALCFAGYLWKTKRFAHLQLFSHFEAPRWSAIWDLLRTGLPIGITVLMEGGLFMIPMGVAEATTVRVGHAVGSGNGLGVRRAAIAGLVIILGTQTLSALVLLLGHDAIVGVYTADMGVAALASTLLLYAAAFQFPDGIQVLSAGALRGLKDTRVPMFIAMFSYWGLGMPLGAGLGLGLGMGPQGMWLGLILGLTAAAILMAWRLRVSSARAGLPSTP